MAEQAVNTIYLLGEQPDQLCSLIIKNLTSKVFDKASSSTQAPGGEAALPETEDTAPSISGTPIPSPAKFGKSSLSRSSSMASLKLGGGGGNQAEQAGSFALAQLVFVVGHVAIKHIVYLELVEREFKRRKDENAKRLLTSYVVRDKEQSMLTVYTEQRKQRISLPIKMGMTLMPSSAMLKMISES